MSENIEWPFEDRVERLERENDELRAQVERLTEANIQLGNDVDIYREGLGQIHNEMETEFHNILEKAVDELKLKLWNKVRDTIHRRGKAELYVRLKQEFEDIFNASGTRRIALIQGFLEQIYDPGDVRAVAHMLANSKGNFDRITLGESIIVKMFERVSETK